MLGIQTQVLMLAEQALLPTEPSPQLVHKLHLLIWGKRMHMPCVGGSEETLEKLNFYFHYVDSKDPTQVTGLVGKYFYPLIHLYSPFNNSSLQPLQNPVFQ